MAKVVLYQWASTLAFVVAPVGSEAARRIARVNKHTNLFAVWRRYFAEVCRRWSRCCSNSLVHPSSSRSATPFPRFGGVVSAEDSSGTRQAGPRTVRHAVRTRVAAGIAGNTTERDNGPMISSGNTIGKGWRRNARHLRRVWTDWLDRRLSGITRRPHASASEIAERLRTFCHSCDSQVPRPDCECGSSIAHSPFRRMDRYPSFLPSSIQLKNHRFNFSQVVV